MKKIAYLICAGLVVQFTSINANADVIIETAGPYIQDTRNAGTAILSSVDVGATSINIAGFNVLGRQLTPGNIRFGIWDDTSPSAPPVFLTAPELVAASVGTEFFESPDFSFTLTAGNRYYLGLISDQQFEYNYSFGGDISANGLTLTGGVNGNSLVFLSPTWGGEGTIQNAIQIRSVPEPSAFALIALAGGLVCTRRRKV